MGPMQEWAVCLERGCGQPDRALELGRTWGVPENLGSILRALWVSSPSPTGISCPSLKRGDRRVMQGGQSSGCRELRGSKAPMSCQWISGETSLGSPSAGPIGPTKQEHPGISMARQERFLGAQSIRSPPSQAVSLCTCLQTGFMCPHPENYSRCLSKACTLLCDRCERAVPLGSWRWVGCPREEAFSSPLENVGLAEAPQQEVLGGTEEPPVPMGRGDKGRAPWWPLQEL